MITSKLDRSFLVSCIYKNVLVVWREQISVTKARTRLMETTWTFYNLRLSVARNIVQ
jgi:hypothetical protein